MDFQKNKNFQNTIKENSNFSLKNRIFSFKYAIKGLSTLLKEEHNARIHFIIACITIIVGIFCQLVAYEWIIIIIMISFVMAMEAINSAIENLADFISPEYQKLIGKAKDLGAAAVLITSVCAVIVGAIIFLPKIIAWMQ